MHNRMENKHLSRITTPNKVQHMQNPKYFNQHPGYQGYQVPQSVAQQQYHGGQFNSLPNQEIPRRGDSQISLPNQEIPRRGDSQNLLPNQEIPRRGDSYSKDFVQYSQHYPRKHSSLNPPFPTTDITFTTHSPPTASAVHNPSYQGRHQDQVTNLQKLQPPGAARGLEERVGGGGLHTYPPRNEPKQYYASDNPLNSGKGQVHSLDRKNLQQKPQTFVNQQHTGVKHVKDYSNSLPRVGLSQPQAGFPIPLDSPTRHPAATVYTKHDHGGFPQQNGGCFHKNTDSHINAPSVQTNANLRGEQHYTQSIAGSQKNPPQQLDSSIRPTGGFNPGIGNSPVVNESGHFTNSRGLPNQSWNSVNGSERRIGSPVSVKVGSQGSGPVSGGDSDTNFPHATTASVHTPVIQNFPRVFITIPPCHQCHLLYQLLRVLVQTVVLHQFYHLTLNYLHKNQVVTAVLTIGPLEIFIIT